ncbi:glycoside hydrolase family 32 protein [Paenibacillus kyungheensis]
MNNSNHASKYRRTLVVLSVFGCIILGALLYFFTQTSAKGSTQSTQNNLPNYSGSNTNATSVSSERPDYHFTVPDKWKNDPQRPIYFKGKYHYYYLYNKDYPNGNGTEWRHATSTDLIHWQDHGVAIPKYTNKNGDPWSGSVVVDTNNTAGFGKNAFIAIVTQPSANGGAQEQYLWYSKNGGNTFTPYGKKPILSNPGTADFRDPKITWDARSKHWIMLMAEGNKIGFYTSTNLKHWTYTSGFLTDNVGILECPDLYLMQAANGAYKWVLGASANGRGVGNPNTYAYWTGSFNGKKFIADRKEPKWLDHGFDWYAAVTFEIAGASNPYEQRYAFGWMNNWDYVNNTPTMKEGFNGMDSIVRKIRLRFNGQSYDLSSQPIGAISQIPASTQTVQRIEVEGTEALPISGASYQLDADISWSDLKNVGLRLRESADKSRHVDVGVFVEGKYTYVNRAYTGHPDTNGKSLESQAAFNTDKKKVHLKVLVDKNSIEVFVDDGTVAYSSLIFPNKEDQGISLFAEGGKAIFENVVLKQFNS